MRNTTATLANTFAYVSPVIAVFLGWIILDENINIRIIVATIVIIVGVILIVNKNKIVLTGKEITTKGLIKISKCFSKY